jgi:hypothetical protein
MKVLSFASYLSYHIPLAKLFEGMPGNPQYVPISVGGIEAQYGFKDRDSGSTHYFDVKNFPWYEEYGIEVEGAAYILDASGRILYDSRLELYLIVLGGQVKINGEELPITNGYHLVVKSGKSTLSRSNSRIEPRYKLFKDGQFS